MYGVSFSMKTPQVNRMGFPVMWESHISAISCLYYHARLKGDLFQRHPVNIGLFSYADQWSDYYDDVDEPSLMQETYKYYFPDQYNDDDEYYV